MGHEPKELKILQENITKILIDFLGGIHNPATLGVMYYIMQDIQAKIDFGGSSSGIAVSQLSSLLQALQGIIQQIPPQGISNVDTNLTKALKKKNYLMALEKWVDNLSSPFSEFQELMASILWIDSKLPEINEQISKMQQEILMIDRERYQIHKTIQEIQAATLKNEMMTLSVAVDSAMSHFLANDIILKAPNIIFGDMSTIGGVLTNGTCTIKSGERLASLFGESLDDVGIF